MSLPAFVFHQGEHPESPIMRTDQLCGLRGPKRTTTREYNQRLEYAGLPRTIGAMEVIEQGVRLYINRSQVAEIFYL